MLAACRANADAEVDVAVPDVMHFDRDALLAPPLDPRLPEPPDGRNPVGAWRARFRWFRYLVGHAIGTVGGTIMHRLSRLLGRRYRGEVWTTWYRKQLYLGILTLAYMREHAQRDQPAHDVSGGQHGSVSSRMGSICRGA